jgi:hypothetical protein
MNGAKQSSWTAKIFLPRRRVCFFFYPKKDKEINSWGLPIKITVEPIKL